MSSATGIEVSTWQIDPAHTQAEFEVKHMMFAKVRGRFEALEGVLELGDDHDLESWSARAKIDAASINTGQEERDAHLRSADFFDVAHHPTLEFESRSVRRGEGRDLVVTGDLTIHGVTREVELGVTESGSATDPWGNERIAFSGSTTIDRRDFGLTWNQALEAGGVLVAHEIHISLEVQAVRAGEA